jgi:hypothetical protein
MFDRLICIPGNTLEIAQKEGASVFAANEERNSQDLERAQRPRGAWALAF